MESTNNYKGALQLLILVLLAGVAEISARMLLQAPSWRSFWDTHLPGVAPPASLAHLASQLTAAETADYVHKLNSGYVSPTGCEDLGRFQCAAQPNAGCSISLTYGYGCGGGGAASTSMVSGLFFRPDKLSAGKKAVYPNLDNDLEGRTFLPAELANAMPFTPNRLPSYLALLGVPASSSMAANMKDTMAFCNSKPLAGEVLACHSSIESMLDFSVSNLGPKLAVLSPAYTGASSEEVLVVTDPVTLSPPDKKAISCHDHMFPYLVYGCHVMLSSRVLQVELQRGDGSSIQGFSVCHTDTTSWNPAHPAFAALNAHPGDGSTLCHWVPHNNFLWIQT